MAVKENIMYIGPTIPGTLRKSTVYSEGKLPVKAEQMVRDYPPMKKLFVKLDKAADAIAQLDKQSALSSIYAQVSIKYGGK